MDAFRKIDIDAYDEDVLAESELYTPDPRPSTQVLSDTRDKASAIRGILARCVRPFLYTIMIYHLCIYFVATRGDIASALVTILQDAPYGPENEEAKVSESTVKTPTTLMEDPFGP